MNNEQLLLITCFICGKDLRGSFIKEHMEQCLPNNQNLPEDYKELFGKIANGTEISDAEVKEFNCKADKLFKEVSLVPCPNCGRKFLHDRVEVHIKSCKGDLKKKKAGMTQSTVNNDSQRLFLEKLEKELQNKDNASSEYDMPKPVSNDFKQNSLTKSQASTERTSNKLKGSIVKANDKKQGEESNKIFLEKLEKELQTQESHSSNKTAATATTMKKKKEEVTENSNKLFLEKLNKELKNEHEPEITEIETMKLKKNTAINKPTKVSTTRSSNLYENKKQKYALKATKEIDSKQKFMELLDKELLKDSEMNKVAEPKAAKGTADDSNKLFLEKLEKEIQKDSGCIQPTGSTKANEIEDKPQGVATKKDKIALEEHPQQLTSQPPQVKKNPSAQYQAQHQPPVKKSQLKVSNILCYICGKGYGSSSLPIHLKTCEVNWRKEHPNVDLTAEKPKILDGLLTQLKDQTLTQSTLDAYIKQAEKAYRILNYFPCPNCGQKFLAERLNVHLKGCHKEPISSTKLFEEKVAKQLEESQSQQNEANDNKDNEEPVSQPPSSMLLCYICGEEFDKKALEAHLELCMKQHTDIHTILPRKLEKIFAKLENEEEELITPEEIASYNALAQKQSKDNSKKESTVPAQVIEEKEEADQPQEEEEKEDNEEIKDDLNKDLSDSMENDHPNLKDIEEEEERKEMKKGNEEEAEEGDNMLACYKCGRRFPKERIEVHMRICKGDN